MSTDAPERKSEVKTPPSRIGAESGETLQTEDGSTTIADAVVSKIAELAAREIRGVHDLQSGVGGAIRRLTPGFDQRGQSASVEVGRKEAIVELDLVIDYGVSIPEVTSAVRQNVMDRVAFMTGLEVKEVNIDVSDLWFADEERRKQVERDRQQQPRVE